MMENRDQHTIYTIGHSTRSLEEFIELLHAFEIKNLADIRSMPGSRKFPWFDSELLEVSLKDAGIDYRLIKKLGGRRKSHKDSKIHAGTKMLSGLMQTIWKRLNLKKGLPICLILQKPEGLPICVRRRSGGAVTVLWFQII